MKHFSEADWADFVRKLVSPKTRMAMQQHIDDGCEKCATSLQVWQGVAAVAGKEAALAPPADIVRLGKSQFAAAAPEKKHGVRLVFDSLLQPATAGIRGSVAGRQFLFETDDYYIDLRLEPKSAEERAWLVGQVLSRLGKQVAEAVPVRLQRGKRAVAQTSTNHLGEFQLEFETATDACILIGRSQEDEIVLPLYGLHAKPLYNKDLD
ncbi:MAG TPA: hypothetical protein VMB18_10960 [Terriglobales bacterium]|nr:hypothetical protein [Terriglobales bacterium]